MKLTDIFPKDKIPNVFKNKKFEKTHKVPKLHKGFYGIARGLNGSSDDDDDGMEDEGAGESEAGESESGESGAGSSGASSSGGAAAGGDSGGGNGGGQ